MVKEKWLLESRHQNVETVGKCIRKFRCMSRSERDWLTQAESSKNRVRSNGKSRNCPPLWQSLGEPHMVPKSDGSWRPCGDYRRLNLVTTPDRYPVPNVHDLASQLTGCTIFSKLDLTKGYYQVPMAREDVPKTAVVTPLGLFAFLRMPFGLRNSGQTFQRLMDHIYAGLNFAFVYLDDALIANPDPVTHICHLRLVLQRFEKHGLLINLKKCEFGVSEISFLGHKVNLSGIATLKKNTQAVQDFSRPSNKTEVQRFLGSVNFYRLFIPAAAKILKPSLMGIGSSLQYAR